MAIDPRNFGHLTGRFVADPEILQGKVVKFSMAADYAGVDADNKDNRSGFFDCVMFLRDDNPNTKFVKGQIDAGNMKKGSSVEVLYSLSHNRWSDKDGNRRSKVELIVESIAYAGSKQDGSSSSQGSTSSSSGGGNASVPSEF